MELKGKLIRIGQLQSGVSANGEWFKKEIVIETQGQYPKKVAIELWRDLAKDNGLEEGDFLTASIDIESREYNSKWYTSVKAFKVQKEQQQPANNPYKVVEGNGTPLEDDPNGESLPF